MDEAVRRGTGLEDGWYEYGCRNYEERLCKHLLELQSGVKFRTSFCDQST